MPFTLPDTARLWVFTADRPLPEGEQAAFMDAARVFLNGWTSHGRPVPGEAEWIEDRFFVVAAHLAEGLNAGVSGCGIDSLTHAVEEAAQAQGFGWLVGLHVAFRTEGGAVEVVPRPTFRALVRAGEVIAETPVFDTTIADLGTLRGGGFECPARDSWHARAFRIGEPA